MSSALPPFERCGVSASFLHMFLHQMLPPNCSMTTSEVCKAVILPATGYYRCAYLDMYRTMVDYYGRPFVAPATVFVSHAWKYNIREPIDVMLEYAEQNPTAYFWFDLFTNNQHNASQLPQEWWKTTFRNAICDIGTVLLVMSPWDNPIPVTRAWCLWEILSALDQPHVKFSIRIPRAMRMAFFDAIVQDSDRLLKVLSNIQAEKAEAFRKEDLDMIFEAIRTTVGFQQMNVRINEQLRHWYVRTAVDIAEAGAMDGAGDKSRIVQMQSQVGNLLWNFGDLDGALKQFQRALDFANRLVGNNHPSIAVIYNNIGSVYNSKGDYDGALEYHQRALALREELLGKDHPTTSESYNNIGSVYQRKGDIDRSLQFTQLALAIREKTLGKDHPIKATAYNNIGFLFNRKGDYDQSLKYYKYALAAKEKAVGKNHPDTATTLSNIGDLYKQKGKVDQALECYEQALAIQQKTRGDDHSETATLYESIANVESLRGNVDKALEYHQQCLAARERIFGADHTSTILSCNQLGALFKRKANFADALKCYQRVLSFRERTLGPDHELTAASLSNIGDVYFAMKDYNRALEVHQHALAIEEKLFGKNHASTASTYINIGVLFQYKEDHGLALQYYQRAYQAYESLYGKNHEETRDAKDRISAVRAAQQEAAKNEGRAHDDDDDSGPSGKRYSETIIDTATSSSHDGSQNDAMKTTESVMHDSPLEKASVRYAATSDDTCRGDPLSTQSIRRKSCCVLM